MADLQYIIRHMAAHEAHDGNLDITTPACMVKHATPRSNSHVQVFTLTYTPLRIRDERSRHVPLGPRASYKAYWVKAEVKIRIGSWLPQ
jgi:hypothetical protein